MRCTLRNKIKFFFGIATLSLTPIMLASADDGPELEFKQVFSAVIVQHSDAKLTSPYGVRTDPFTENSSWHGGVDIGEVPMKTELFAPAAGEVIYADYKAGYGRMIDLKLDESGHIIRYAHLFDIKVEVGEQLDAGALVGRVGSPGRSFGPHVHVEYHIDDKQYDPSKIPGLKLLAEVD